MTVIIFGATGMVGTGVVLEWLDDPRIDRVLSVSRHPVAIHNPKLRTIVHRDFFDFATIHPQFSGADRISDTRATRWRKQSEARTAQAVGLERADRF